MTGSDKHISAGLPVDQIDTMSGKEYSSESHSSTDSYYHCKDIRYPVCNLTLPELYERHKTLDTDKGVTWHLPSYRLTYKEIYEQAQDIARGLLSLGLKEGDVVLSLGSTCPDSLLLFVAGSLIGLVFSSPYLSNPFVKNITYRIEKLSPKAILVGGSFAGYDHQPVGPSLFKVLADLGEKKDHIIIFTDREYINWKEHANEYPSRSAHGCMPLERVAKMSSQVSEQHLKQCMKTMTSTQPCFTSFSSGSTGEPKLVLHGAKFLVNAGVFHLARGTRSKSTTVGTLDMVIEDLAHYDDVMTGFYLGCEIVVLPRIRSWADDAKAITYLEAIQQHRINVTYGDQGVLGYIVNNPEIMKDYDVTTLSALVMAGVGSSPAFKSKLVQLFPDSMDLYGMTECYYISMPSSGEMASKNNLKSVGRPHVNTEVKIVDENGICVPRNERGEVWVRNCATMVEYVGDHELTKKTCTDDGWLKTGDCAIMDDDNYLQLVGRMTKSERFKVFCDPVYAQAVEFQMKTMAEIETIIVVGRDLGNADGCELIYCVKLKEGECLSGEKIFEYAKENLFSHNEWPVRVIFLEDFPRKGGRNKISRKDLLCEMEKKVHQNVNEGIVNLDYLTC